MAKLERTPRRILTGCCIKSSRSFLQGSFTATLEDSSDFYGEGARCSVRVFERYSYFGGNRLSLNLTLFQAGNGPVQLSAITAGGSEAVFLRSIPSEKKPFWINWKKFYKHPQSQTGPLHFAKVRFFDLEIILYQ